MRVACLQMCSGIDRDTNLTTVEGLLAQAAGQGAKLALLPENFGFMGGSDAEKKQIVEDQNHSATLRFLSEQAAVHQMYIIGGALLLKGEDARIRNASPVFDARGQLLTIYDKIHLFDMDYKGEAYCESALIESGRSPAAVSVGSFRIGLSICYDLRFPELYRVYADDSCDILCNVAAFTATTGRAHWQTLLKARAIENQTYVLASAQWGRHPNGRETWGHSMIIDPWGKVLAELPEGDGVVLAELSKKRLHQVRESLPSLRHRKL
ncbi:MAG: carbon-nitrogen hydrolase family protein [Mariprofundus sp.]|nr:carbon-nitrogen hydrolase family protein [Mariprofundus sp.]